MRNAVLLAALVAALLVPASAISKPTSFNTQVRHYAWPHLTITQRITAQRRLVADDWRIITTWRSHQLEQLRVERHLVTTPKTWSAVSAILPAEPYPIHWRYLHMKWTQRELHKSLHLQAHLAVLQNHLYLAPAYASGTVEQIIASVFHEDPNGAEAVAHCESGYSTAAVNGQYLGIFQMGSNERATYATIGYSTAYEQIVAAHNYYVAAHGWGPWECRP